MKKNYSKNNKNFFPFAITYLPVLDTVRNRLETSSQTADNPLIYLNPFHSRMNRQDLDKTLIIKRKKGAHYDPTLNPELDRI